MSSFNLLHDESLWRLNSTGPTLFDTPLLHSLAALHSSSIETAFPNLSIPSCSHPCYQGCPKYPPSCRSPGSAFQPTVRTACFRLTVRKPIPCVRALLSVIPYSILAYSRSADTPFVLFALLLLSAPDGFTFRSLFAFDGFGERTGVNIDRLPYRIGMLRSI